MERKTYLELELRCGMNISQAYEHIMNMYDKLAESARMNYGF